MRRHLRTLVAALTIAIAGCAGTPFKWEDASKVRNGMTEAEVTTILGKPYSRTQSGARSVLTWSYADAFGSAAKAVSFVFDNGRVTGSTTAGR